MRTAYAVVGEPFTEQAYKKWRTSELLKEGLGPQSIPSSWTVSARFRGWFTACETILRAEEADEDEVNNDSGSDESGGKGGSGVGGGDGSAGDSCAGAPAHA